MRHKSRASYAPPNHWPGHRPEAPGWWGQNHPPDGGSQYALIHAWFSMGHLVSVRPRLPRPSQALASLPFRTFNATTDTKTPPGDRWRGQIFRWFGPDAGWDSPFGTRPSRIFFFLSWKNGNIIMIGATTGKSFFSVTPPSAPESRFLSWNPLQWRHPPGHSDGPWGQGGGFDFEVQLDDDALDFCHYCDQRGSAAQPSTPGVGRPIHLSWQKKACAISAWIMVETACNAPTSPWIKWRWPLTMSHLPCKIHPRIRCGCPAFIMQPVWLRLGTCPA